MYSYGTEARQKIYYPNIFVHTLVAGHKVLELGLSDQICGNIRYSVGPVNEMAHLLVMAKNQRLGCTNAEILCLDTTRSSNKDWWGWLSLFPASGNIFVLIVPLIFLTPLSFYWVWQKYPTGHQIFEQKVELCSVTPQIWILLRVVTWGHRAITGHAVRSANTNCSLHRRITFGELSGFFVLFLQGNDEMS